MGTAKNAELMLQTNDIDLIDVEKIRCELIIRQVFITDLKAYLGGIEIASGRIVNDHRVTLIFWRLCR